MSNKVTRSTEGTGGGGGGNANKIYDLSSQLDGVTLTFSLPPTYTAISLMGTEFPGVYRPTVDFSSTPDTVTLIGVPAPASGQTLLALCSVSS